MAGLGVLSAMGLGACQILTGLSGYREAGSASGPTGGASSASTGSSGAAGSSASSTGSSTGSSSGSTSSGTSSSGSTSSGSTSSSGTGGSPACAAVVCDIPGQVEQLRTNDAYVGWSTTPAALGWASLSTVPTNRQASVAPPFLDETALAMDANDLWFIVAMGTLPVIDYWPIEPDASTAFAALSGASGDTPLEAIASGGSYVVWAQEDPASLTWSLAGSQGMAAPVTLTTVASKPYVIATDGQYVFWTLGNDVWAGAVPGGGATSFFTATGGVRVTDIAVEPAGKNVYWLTSDGLIRRAPEADPSSDVTMVYPNTTTGSVHQLRTDGAYVYWTEWSTCQAPGGVFRASITSPMVPTTPFVSAQCPVIALDATHQYLYYSTIATTGPVVSAIGRMATQ